MIGGPMETIRGEVERITFRNEEDGYSVVALSLPGVREPLYAVGRFTDIVPGEVLELSGEWHYHPHYGRQFRVISYRSAMPSTQEGLRKYLASGLIKGIGPVIAERIVQQFGEHTVEVMEREPERLREVEGIGHTRLEHIKEAWATQRDIRSLMEFLQRYDIPTGYAARMFKHYGVSSLSVLRDDPYRVAAEVRGIGFLTADAMARKLGIPADSPLRARGALLYVLQKMAAEGGHICVPEGVLIRETMHQLGIDDQLLVPVLTEMVTRGEVVREESEVAQGIPHIYLPGLFTCETVASKKMLEISRFSRKLIISPPLLHAVERALSFTLDETQRAALMAALTHKVTIITGGPGTGKTTVVQAITTAATLLGLTVLLAAPTGKAAKRLEESTRRRACTIHRLLRYTPKAKANQAKGGNIPKQRGNEGSFLHDTSSPLKGDILILDEASMLDLPLLHHLLKAVPREMSLVFVGDVDQLPSIGPGTVLRDLIESGIFPVVRLSIIHRQARQSHIVLNAHRIIEGKMPIVQRQRSSTRSDFYVIAKDDAEGILSVIGRLCVERIPRRFGFSPRDDIQVLTPVNRGILGTTNINRLLQDLLNPRGAQIEWGGRRLRVGDRVMQTRNDYDRDVYNGDTGRVHAIDADKHLLLVDFDGRIVSYDVSELDDLTLAYAVSIHKAQGSEYPAVVIPLATQHYVMLQRNLLYTAVTRAKRLVIIVGTMRAIAIAVRTTTVQHRFGLFQRRLQLQAPFLSRCEEF